MRPRLRIAHLAWLAASVALGSAGCSRQPPQEAAAFLGKFSEEWIEQLDSADRLDRLAAVRALGEILRQQPAHSRVLTALSGAAAHPDRAVRYWAVRAVGQIPEAESRGRPRMLEALADAAPEVRVWAAYGLCRWGLTPQGLPVLLGELYSTSETVRLQAAQALAALGEEARPALDDLRRAVHDENSYVGRVATRAVRSLEEAKQPAR